MGLTTVLPVRLCFAGYDRYGYDKYGYNKDGYHKEGYHKVRPLLRRGSSHYCSYSQTQRL
jgi:hypothetical protein